MKRLLLICLAAAGCDPIWSVHATLRDPGSRRIEGATLAVACPDGAPYAGLAARSKRDGVVQVGSLGTVFPFGCDIFVARPGYRTQRIRYRDLCPDGPEHCDRVFDFDLVLEPE